MMSLVSIKKKLTNAVIFPTKENATSNISTEKKFLKDSHNFILKGLIHNYQAKKHELNIKYKNSKDYFFYSYGIKTGNFYFPYNSNILNSISQNNYYFSEYALVDVKTEYYTLMFDFDFKEKHNCADYKDKADQIIDFVIEHINSVLKDCFIKPNIQYLYCDKISTVDNSDEYSKLGVHLYYPHIIVNKFIHNAIYKKAFNKILNDKQFSFSKEQWENMFDACIASANGLRLPYFCIKNSFYKQNKSKSTYNVPEYDGKPNAEILKLCCIRTDNTEVYPKTNIETYEIIDDNTNKNKSKKSNKLATSVIEQTIVEQEYKNEYGEKYILTFKTKSQINRLSLDLLDKLLECMNISHFLHYEQWFSLKFIVFNCNNSIEACKIFHKYCCVGEYKNLEYYETEDSFMKTMEAYDFDINVLKCYARKDNPTLFNSKNLNSLYDPQTFESNKVNLPKLTKLKGDLNDTEIEIAVKEFLHDDHQKILCLIAGYNNGKTTLNKDTIIKYSDIIKRCIFTTHRRTLATDVERNFKDAGFISYLDKEHFTKSEKKIIINMDSLKCLQLHTSFFNSTLIIQKYDLLILDEIESLLNHFESSLMDDKRNDVYNIFCKLIIDTKKIIACDGDFSNRAYQFLTDIVNKNQVVIYQNVYKQAAYHFIFTKNEIAFLDNIEKDLKKGLKIVLPCISSKKAQEFEKYFSGKKYKVLCITGDSDNNTKNLLTDPEKIFNIIDGYCLFIYSPTITVGLNLDLTYFHSQYCYICPGCISARDFMQMMFRVRQLENTNVTILLSKAINTNSFGNFYSIEEVVKTLSIELRKNPNDLSAFDRLRMWNYWEDINSKHYFFQVLLHFIKKKNYTYKILEDIDDEYYHANLTMKKKEMGIIKGEDKQKLLENIVNAENISIKQMSELLKNKKKVKLLILKNILLKNVYIKINSI
jgi:hypothetical protein